MPPPPLPPGPARPAGSPVLPRQAQPAPAQSPPASAQAQVQPAQVQPQPVQFVAAPLMVPPHQTAESSQLPGQSSGQNQSQSPGQAAMPQFQMQMQMAQLSQLGQMGQIGQMAQMAQMSPPPQIAVPSMQMGQMGQMGQHSPMYMPGQVWITPSGVMMTSVMVPVLPGPHTQATGSPQTQLKSPQTQPAQTPAQTQAQPMAQPVYFTHGMPMAMVSPVTSQSTQPLAAAAQITPQTTPQTTPHAPAKGPSTANPLDNLTEAAMQIVSLKHNAQHSPVAWAAVPSSAPIPIPHAISHKMHPDHHHESNKVPDFAALKLAQAQAQQYSQGQMQPRIQTKLEPGSRSTPRKPKPHSQWDADMSDGSMDSSGDSDGEVQPARPGSPYGHLKNWRRSTKGHGQRFRCRVDTCRLRFNCPAELFYHLQEVHTANKEVDWNERMYCRDTACAYSILGFPSRGELNRHLRGQHRDPGVVLYKCRGCDRAFARSDSLKRHTTTCAALKDDPKRILDKRTGKMRLPKKRGRKRKYPDLTETVQV